MTIDQKAHEAYAANRALKEKYHIHESFWIDWFRKGYEAAIKWQKVSDATPSDAKVVLVKVELVWKKANSEPSIIPSIGQYLSPIGWNIIQNTQIGSWNDVASWRVIEWRVIE